MKFINGNNEYYILQKMSNNAGLIVECFFLISGYFLYNSIKNDKESILKFIFKKIFRLGPVLWTSIVLGIVFFKQSYIVGLFNSLFLQCVGLSLDYKGINWYISPFFWAIVFYYIVIKTFDNQRTNVFFCGLVYFCYLANITLCKGSFGRETVYGIINLGLARALAGIGLGYMIGVCLEHIKDIRLIKKDLYRKYLFSLLEIMSSGFLIRYFLFGLGYKNGFVVVIMFSILLICFVKQLGIISTLLNRPVFSIFGKYSYSIYVMQQSSFYILQKTYWKTDVVNDTFLCISSSLAFCVLIGVFVYHFIEKPAYKKGLEVLKGVK